jgi:hypothetical protein
MELITAVKSSIEQPPGVPDVQQLQLACKNKPMRIEST